MEYKLDKIKEDSIKSVFYFESKERRIIITIYKKFEWVDFTNPTYVKSINKRTRKSRVFVNNIPKSYMPLIDSASVYCKLGDS